MKQKNVMVKFLELTNNKNINQNNTTSDNTNRNINESNSTQTINQNVKSKAPPASAIAPSIMSYSQDLCTTGVSGAFQGQIFGFSGGKFLRSLRKSDIDLLIKKVPCTRYTFLT